MCVGRRPRGRLSGALEEAAGACDGDRLIHHPLADAEVLVNPFGNVFVVAGNFLGLETGPRTSRNGAESDEPFSKYRVFGWGENSRQAGRALHSGEEGRDWEHGVSDVDSKLSRGAQSLGSKRGERTENGIEGVMC